MNSDQNTNKTSLAARFKMVIAGLALAGVLAGGASAIVDVDPINSEDTTETALSVSTSRVDMGSWASARGVSWH